MPKQFFLKRIFCNNFGRDGTRAVVCHCSCLTGPDQPSFPKSFYDRFHSHQGGAQSVQTCNGGRIGGFTLMISMLRDPRGFDGMKAHTTIGF